MATGKTSKDARSAMGSFMAQSAASADSRFAVAADITAKLPTGISTVSPAMPTPIANTPSSLPPISGTVMALISRTKDNPFNARQFYDEQVVHERTASLARDGQLQPAPACIDPDDPTSFILIGGHYRKRALLALGREYIELKLLPVKTRLDFYRLSFSENNEREAGTPLDNAIAWQKLHDDGVVDSDEEITKAIGVSRAVVNKHRLLLQLPVDVLNILKETPQKFTLTAAYELYTLASMMPVADLMQVAKKIASPEGFSTRELHALKASIQAAENRPLAERKVREISRQHKIMVGDSLVGHIKDWDNGRVELDIKIDDPVEREKVVAELRARFGAKT